MRVQSTEQQKLTRRLYELTAGADAAQQLQLDFTRVLSSVESAIVLADAQCGAVRNAVLCGKRKGARTLG
jgi:hypothetical protein